MAHTQPHLQSLASGRWILPLFLFLFIGTRLLVLFLSDHTARNVVDNEDMVRGVLPLHMMRGLQMPVHMYQYDEYSGAL